MHNEGFKCKIFLLSAILIGLEMCLVPNYERASKTRRSLEALRFAGNFSCSVVFVFFPDMVVCYF